MSSVSLITLYFGLVKIFVMQSFRGKNQEDQKIYQIPCIMGCIHFFLEDFGFHHFKMKNSLSPQIL